MVKILCVGDIHGHFYDLEVILNQAIKKFNIDGCIQVGDFGFYPAIFQTYTKKFPVPVHAIDGNHENHEWLKKSLKKGVAEDWRTNRNLEFVPRGTTLLLDGCKFGFVGGAYNVDRPQFGSTGNRSTNYLLDVEVEEAAKKFNDFGQLDFLITHSCPHSIGVGMKGEPYFLPLIQQFITKPLGVTCGRIDDCGDQPLKSLWHKLKVKPRNWIFGHFHKYHQKQVENTVFTCIGAGDLADGHDFTIPFIIDTKEKSFEAFPKHTLMNATGFHKTRVWEPQVNTNNPYPI